MSDLRKAAEMALEALIGAEIHDPEAVQESIQALRQALAQPEWVGLTDEEVFYLAEYLDCCKASILNAEAKLKEKNT